MVCVIIPFPIKGYAISYHSNLKYNVQIENIEPLICFRYVLNNLIDIPTIYRYIREYNFFLKYLNVILPNHDASCGGHTICKFNKYNSE